MLYLYLWVKAALFTRSVFTANMLKARSHRKVAQRYLFAREMCGAGVPVMLELLTGLVGNYCRWRANG